MCVQAQNALVNRTVAAAEQQLAAKLERVVGALAVNRVMLGVAVFHGLMALLLTVRLTGTCSLATHFLIQI